jgi:hypothetical protein
VSRPGSQGGGGGGDGPGRGAPDDPDLGPISDEERALAQSFARHLDDLVAGKPAPPAMEAEARALLETATAVHASLAATSLSPARVMTLVDQALAAGAAGSRAGARASLPHPLPEPEPEANAAQRRRRRLAQTLPWLLTACAAAAALVLWVQRPTPLRPPQAVRTLRSVDALVGPIPLAEAGEASARLDLIYADRLAARQREPGARERRQ